MIEVLHLTTSRDAVSDHEVAKLYFDIVSKADLNAIRSIFNAPEEFRQKGIYYRLVAKVDTNEKGKAFELTNHIDAPWTSNEGVEVMAKNVRSTSVGDVMIQDSNQYFSVAPQGFTQFDSRFSKVLTDDDMNALKGTEVQISQKLRNATTVRTSDGYIFDLQPDGSWTDGDMSFQSLDDLYQACEGEVSIYQKAKV